MKISLYYNCNKIINNKKLEMCSENYIREDYNAQLWSENNIIHIYIFNNIHKRIFEIMMRG